MSVDQLPRRAPRPADDAKLVKYEEYIDTQIRSTRRAVKGVELATAVVTLSAAVLAFLLVIAVVEHWLLPGGFNTFGRTVLFALLAGGAGYFAYRRIWPLVLHTINPIYAAQAIEHSSPTLKNSLLNLLLFRQHRSEIPEAVYTTLEEQAAQRLTRVPVDAAVDRTQLIRFGYVLLAVVSLAAIYKVLSPKDPLVTAERVLRPWAAIVPASRVQITAVEPGDVTIARGEFLDVAAEVRGLGESDSIVLRYTTADGQAVGKAVPMHTAGDGQRFTGRLPDGADAAAAVGIAQNLIYRIEAGDARSLDYRVAVVAAPTILVQRVDYEYPEYTGYQNRSVEEMGDIRAIEGTRVTIHARANGPIDEAFVDFGADGRRDLRMSSDGTRAQAQFVLGLREDRRTPRHSSYVLRLTNRDGRTNRNPVKYPIDVVPDYSPEVAILAPEEEARDVRLDETVVVEVEARDPDFALSEVRLLGEAAGRPDIDEPLLDQEHTGRFTTRYRFTPNEHSLRAGDVVKVRVVANDNRAPTPNSATTDPKTFRIAAPDPDQQPPPDHIAQHDQRRQQEPQLDQPQEGEQQPQEGESQPGEQEAGRDDQQGEPDGEQQPGDSAARNGHGEQPADDSQEVGHDGQRSADGEAGQEGDPAAADERTGEQREDAGDRQEGAEPADGERSQDGAPGAGTRPDGQPGADDLRRERSPISSEGDNDAEAFERIRRHMQERGETGDDGAAESASPDGPDGERPPDHEPTRSHDDESPSHDAERRADEELDERPEGAADGQQPDHDRDPTLGRDDPTSADGQDSQHGDPPPDGDVDGRTDELPRPDGTDPSDAQREPRDARDQGLADEHDDSRPGERAAEDQSEPGHETGERNGVADSQEPRPTEDRQQRPSSDVQPDDVEPPATGQPGRDTDTEGEHGADRPGGGDEGSEGQQAPREGAGSAGQHEPAEEGAGESTEPGLGDDSFDPGTDATSDQRTGEPGSEAGEGSTQRERDAGSADGEQQPDREQDPFGRDGDRSADDPDGQPGEPAPADGQRPGDSDPAPADGTQPGTPSGDPAPRRDPIPPPSSDATAPEGDEANLEYARKQTDLVLETLADQLARKQVDEELLEDLGWTEEELQQFVARWQERKERARSNNPAADAARRELDEALRNLGLRPGELQQSQVREDDLRDFSEGYRGRVPLEYRERLRAYSEGVSRSRQQAD